MFSSAPFESSALEALDAFLERFDALLESAPDQALLLVDNADAAIRAEAAWVLCRAEAIEAVMGSQAAVDYLESVVATEPGFADAHHSLGELYRQLGDVSAAVRHHLETLRLDTLADTISEPTREELTREIAAEASRAIAELPPKMRERLLHLPVLLQPRPTPSLVQGGFDARTLGLFEGPNVADWEGQGVVAEPTAITLFTHCLVDAFGDDEQELLEQVRVTVLHEIGHYFCLNEEQLAELGLD